MAKILPSIDHDALTFLFFDVWLRSSPFLFVRSSMITVPVPFSFRRFCMNFCLCLYEVNFTMMGLGFFVDEPFCCAAPAYVVFWDRCSVRFAIRWDLSMSSAARWMPIRDATSQTIWSVLSCAVYPMPRIRMSRLHTNFFFHLPYRASKIMFFQILLARIENLLARK